MAHSNGALGFSITCVGGTIGTTTSWRNVAYGASLKGLGAAPLFVSTLVSFGNTSSQIITSSDGSFIIFSDLTINAEAVYTANYGLLIQTGAKCFVLNSSFGATFAHTLYDINLSGGVLAVYLYNTTLASSVEVLVNNYGGACYSQKHDASATTFKQFQKYGTFLSETTIRHTASGYSWKMTPNNATYKMLMPGPTFIESWQSAVVASATVTISVWMWADATYNEIGRAHV